MVDNRLLARVLRRSGGRLVNAAVDRVMADATPAPNPSIGQRIAGAALLRIASRSVPGAILVAGGLLAKHLTDKRKAAKTADPGATGDAPGS